LDGLEQTFFIWVHYFDPHYGYRRHKDFDFGRRDVDKYDSEIAYTDYHINRLLEGLKQRGFFNKTIIVVVADHGEEFYDHGHIHHLKLYEEIIHIPLLVRVPGFKHQVVREFVVESDIAPTITNLVGLSFPGGVHGTVMPFDEGGFKPRNRTVYSETRRKADLMSVIENRYKLIIDNENKTMELYNLREDPREKNNIVSKNQGKVLELKDKLLDFYSKPTEDSKVMELSRKQLKALQDLGYVV
jgi:arylsulfatase A-like enzyme